MAAVALIAAPQQRETTDLDECKMLPKGFGSRKRIER